LEKRKILAPAGNRMPAVQPTAPTSHVSRRVYSYCSRRSSGHESPQSRSMKSMEGMSGCQFSSQFSVNGWLILVQTPCERKLYAKGPLPPPLLQPTIAAVAASKTVPRKTTQRTRKHGSAQFGCSKTVKTYSLGSHVGT
jgi:hypothetical protein